ncbi:MAG: phenylalanine--tRNA ligase subunit beta [Candidatus Anstonellales archaeon]
MASVEYFIKFFEEFTCITKEEAEDLLPNLGFPVEFIKDNQEEKIVIDITPNRPDLLSIIGIRRLIKNFKNETNELIDFSYLHKFEKSDKYKIFVDKSTYGVRNYIASLVVEGISLNEELFNELIQFQEKLHLTFGRKRKKIAIGLHDLTKVKFPVYYRAYNLDEKSFVPLNESSSLTLNEILLNIDKGKEYSHLVFRKGVIVEDSEDVLAFPPIINAAKTTVTEKTKGFFIDVTGTNLFAVEKTIDMFNALFNDLNCKTYNVEVIYPNDDPRKLGSIIYPNYREQYIDLPREEIVKKYVGINLDERNIKKYLNRMGFTICENKVLIPNYRVDVLSYHDLLEDIAIVYGYNNIEKVVPELFTVGKLITWRDSLHELMLSLGFSEVLTWVLGNEKKYENFFDGNYAKMINSLTTEYTLVRPLIFPGLLEVFSKNKTFRLPQRIYEIGQVSEKIGNELVCREHLAAAIMDKKVDVNQMIAYLNGFFYDLNLNYEISNKNFKGFIPGRVAKITLLLKDNPKEIGLVGEVHPEVLDKFSIPFPVMVFELDLSRIREVLEKKN